jgi:hypothetical protein
MRLHKGAHGRIKLHESAPIPLDYFPLIMKAVNLVFYMRVKVYPTVQ